MVADARNDPTKFVHHPRRPGLGLKREPVWPDEQPGSWIIGVMARGNFRPKTSFPQDQLRGEVLPASVRPQRCVMPRENHHRPLLVVGQRSVRTLSYLSSCVIGRLAVAARGHHRHHQENNGDQPKTAPPDAGRRPMKFRSVYHALRRQVSDAARVPVPSSQRFARAQDARIGIAR